MHFRAHHEASVKVIDRILAGYDSMTVGEAAKSNVILGLKGYSTSS